MKTSAILASGILSALLAAPVAAQLGPTSPFAVEVQGNVAFPTGDFGEGDELGEISTGWGGTVTGIFNVTPMLGVYAGYTYNIFGSDTEGLEAALRAEGFEGEAKIDAIDRGFNAGAILSLARVGTLEPFLRGGVVYHQLKADLSDDLERFFDEGTGGLITEDDLASEYSLGFQVGGGLTFPLGNRISVVPALTYTRYTPDHDDIAGEETESSDVSYLQGSIGLRVRF